MFSSHIGQALQISGATERSIQTGMEGEYGKYTFNQRMPCDGKIVRIFERYPASISDGSIKENPETIVIYEEEDTKILGYFRLTSFCSNHQYFGFRYQDTDNLSKIRPGQSIRKDTVFRDSPAVTSDGGYKYGIQANVVMMTHPAVAEDGVVISESFAQRLKFSTFETRVIEWGNNSYALNLYGDENNYKVFPDIGDVVREDGILMALRDYEPSILAGIEQNIYDTMCVDHTFDTVIYANGPGGIVRDVRVQHDLTNGNYAERTMDDQVKKYDTKRRIFHQSIVDWYNAIKRQKGDSLHITPELHKLIVESLAVISEGGSHPKVTKLYRKVPLDVYRVEIIVEYINTPSVGNKLTGLAGDKGVTCRVLPDAHMPVDQEGNVADIIMDPYSTFNRMNPARLYEHYFNSSNRHVHITLCKMLGVGKGISLADARRVLRMTSSELIDQAFDYLINYYKLFSDKMLQWARECDDKVEYLTHVVANSQGMVGLYLPPDYDKDTEDILDNVEASIYRPHFGPVTYIGNSGERRITKENIRVGSLYILLLEKTGDDWSSVSSAKRQHLGVIAPLTKQDKYAKPARLQAPKCTGEAELRIIKSYTIGNFGLELMDRNNNPVTHKAINRAILTADKPSNIDVLINRKEIPFGGAKPLVLVRHISECAGFKFSYKPFNPTVKENIIVEGDE